jgi:purine-nucleoside phosphorylase
MKVLSGAHRKDAGRIAIEGREVEIAGPRHARELGVAVAVPEAFASHTGQGATGVVDGVAVAVGNAALMTQWAVDVAPLRADAERLAAEGKTPVYAAVDGKLAAVLAVADPIRPTSREAAARLRERLGSEPPSLAVVLGSGLGGLADDIVDARVVPFHEIPGFPPATVAGHTGAVIGGRLDGRSVVALAGRFHMYEGHSAALAAFPVRVMRALGAETLFVSNAAGGVRRTLCPGDLMIIADHINLMWRNPLIGALEPGDERFPDMSGPYDPALRARLREAAAEVGVPITEGVYAGLLGPAYETPAEVRMLERLGADVVGMSTVPEVAVARAMGMRVAGVSCITNLACGISPSPLSHAEVLETTQRVGEQFRRLVRAFVRRV